MRVILIPLLAASTIAAAETGPDASGELSAQHPEALVEGVPSENLPVPATAKALGLEAKAERDCGDTITQAREEAGEPPLLDREPASPDKPHLIYAVDKRVDGCAVMVMKGNPADIRPLPKPADGPFVIMPLGSGR